MTRQNTIPSEDGTYLVNALIPLWDFCNHTNGEISTDYNFKQHKCECLAIKDYKKDEQFFISYGNRSNTYFFIHNGFVYEDNKNDGYNLKLGISKSDVLKDKRTKLLNEIKTPTQGDFFISTGPEPFDNKIISFLRVFNMNEDELDHWTQSNRAKNISDITVKLNTELDSKVWKFLKTRLQLLLASRTHTSDSCLQLMKNNISPCKKLVCQIQMTETNILHNAIDYIDKHSNK